MDFTVVHSTVAQMQAEFIKKLHWWQSGVHQQQDSEVVLEVLDRADDPQLIKAILTQARSLKYRCSHSARLMRSPMRAPERKWWHRSRQEPPSGQHCTSLDEEVKATAYSAILLGLPLTSLSTTR
jgi:hypothetical protein